MDFYNYKIPGTCNLPLAYKSLLSEDKIGIILSCNVIIQEKADGQVEVFAINPSAFMQAVENEELADIAAEVKKKLRRVMDIL